MKNQVTIIPEDKIIIVDGVAFYINFLAPENIHAIQWYGNCGHCEYIDDTANKILTIEDYETEVAPYVLLWNDEKTKLEKEQLKNEAEYYKPENIKKMASSRIDFFTQSSILAGFDYKINDKTLHFSYQYDDQQNFSDTFNAIAVKKLMGVETTHDAIEWNGWENYTPENKGKLVVITLNSNDFIKLYINGALVHKQSILELGKQRKKAIEDAISVEEINNLLEVWKI